MPQPTLREIAAKAGVGHNTVHLALKGDPRVAPATRAKIEKVAKEMGYVANPLISAYQAAVRSRKRSAFRGTIGWITDMDSPEQWHLDEGKELWRGSSERAQQLGYSLDRIDLAFLRKNPTEANLAAALRILDARGILGIVLGGTITGVLAAMDWGERAVVVLRRQQGLRNTSLFGKLPHLRYEYTQAAYDDFGNMHRLMEALLARGYRRPAFFTTPWHDRASDTTFRAAFMTASERFPERLDRPTLVTYPEPAGQSEFAAWIQQQRPDVLVTCLYEPFSWLKNLGLRIPEEIGLVHPSLGPLEVDWAGIEPAEADLGRTGIELAAAAIERNERGAPKVPKQVLIKSRWREGSTVRAAADAAAPAKEAGSQDNFSR